MNQIACSTGIRSSQSLGEAYRVIRDIGFTYADPFAFEPWHIKPSQLVEDCAHEAEKLNETLANYALKCIAINLRFLHNFTMCTPEEHATNLEVLRGTCHVAQSAGTDIVTISPGSMRGDSPRATIDQIEYIEDCGALKEGYDAKDETLALIQILLDKDSASHEGMKKGSA